ncbi:MAG: hypothetical protein WAM24_04815 [Ignavibacteriaceae bacterium]
MAYLRYVIEEIILIVIGILSVITIRIKKTDIRNAEQLLTDREIFVCRFCEYAHYILSTGSISVLNIPVYYYILTLYVYVTVPAAIHPSK